MNATPVPKPFSELTHMESKGLMRAPFLRLSLHLLAGALLAWFLMPEGAAVALAGAVAATLVKGLYDYLRERIEVWNGIALLVGACLAVAALS